MDKNKDKESISKEDLESMLKYLNSTDNRRKYSEDSLRYLESILFNNDNDKDIYDINISGVLEMSDVRRYVEGKEVYNFIIKKIMDSSYEDLPLYVGMKHDELIRWRLEIGDKG